MAQVPAKVTPFSTIEPAFAKPANQPHIVQGWCPVSKLIGETGFRKQSAGLAWGECPSEYINVRDADMGCMFESRLHGVSWGTNKDSTPMLFGYMDGKPTRASEAASVATSFPGVGAFGENFGKAGVGGACESSSYGSYNACPGCNVSGYETYGAGSNKYGVPGSSCGCGSSVDWAPSMQKACATNNGTAAYKQTSTFLGNKYDCGAFKY